MAVESPSNSGALEAADAARLEAFFKEAGIGDGVAGMPADIAEQIRSGLRKRFISPPCASLEACLGRSVPVAKARQLLFYPSDEDMALYPLLLAHPPPGADQEHPQFKVLVVALTMVYMVHCKSLERVRPFIEAGGLEALVELLTHSNMHIVSQALHSLLLITDEELYPWHEPPMTTDGRGPRHGPDKAMWRHMFELSRSPLISNLLRLQPDVFPGSAMMALRLLAFFTSWLRFHFTPDRVLRLSSELLQVLRQWSERDGISPEEQELAKKLYEDFSRFPPAEHPSLPQLGAGATDTTVAEDDGDENDVRVVADRTQVNPAGPSQAERLKDEGNAAYKEGLFSKAIQLYSEALDVPVAAADLLSEGSRRAVYHANRAASYLARASGGPLRAGDSDTAGLLEGVDHGEEDALQRHWQAALMDAESALQLNPSYTRAYLRKAQALHKLRRLQEAVAAAQLGLNSAATSVAGAGGGGGAPLQRELRELVAELKEEVEAQARAGKVGGGSAQGVEGVAAAQRQERGGEVLKQGAAEGGLGVKQRGDDGEDGAAGNATAGKATAGTGQGAAEVIDLAGLRTAATVGLQGASGGSAQPSLPEVHDESDLYAMD